MDYKVPDILKFAGMLIVYTFYMSWWASHIETQMDATILAIQEHVEKADHPAYQTQAILSLNKVQEQQAVILQEMLKDHARCKIILELMDKRMQKLEELERREHRQ